MFQNHLAIVKSTDRIVELDKKILDRKRQEINDRGWTRQRRSAAKLPPGALFREKSDTIMSGPTAATKKNEEVQSQNRGGASRYTNYLKPKLMGT
mmetsp:Transcript_10464/g.17560  ORF Transcript_10464/g.17560 Transcript_10464/m.17560 type:complete len:95 (+) Transcript_10464:357-641(+)